MTLVLCGQFDCWKKSRNICLWESHSMLCLHTSDFIAEIADFLLLLLLLLFLFYTTGYSWVH